MRKIKKSNYMAPVNEERDIRTRKETHYRQGKNMILMYYYSPKTTTQFLNITQEMLSHWADVGFIKPTLIEDKRFYSITEINGLIGVIG
jgi:hypothetical protein